MNQSDYFTPQSHDHSVANGPNSSKVKEQCLTGRLTGLNTKERVAEDAHEKLDSVCSSKSKSKVKNSDKELNQKEKIKSLTNGYQLQSNCHENHSDSSYQDNLTDTPEGQQMNANNHTTNTNDRLQRGTEDEERPKTEQVDKGEQILKDNVNNSCDPPNAPHPHETFADASLVPTVLYQHRVRGLVLALLVETEFNTDPTAREEVVRCLSVFFLHIWNSFVIVRFCIAFMLSTRFGLCMQACKKNGIMTVKPGYIRYF